jgi:parallel beta-helix repeat protein
MMLKLLIRLTFSLILVTGGNTVCNALPQQVIAVKSYGAKGDGKTNDSEAIGKALSDAASQNAALSFEAKKIYLVDTLSLTGTAAKPYQKLTIIGNGASLKSMSKSAGNILSFFFVDNLMISGLKITGNKIVQKNGNGVGVYYSKNLLIENCIISNCKLSGILIAWTRNATIRDNRIYNNGDGTLPSDGITVHSLQEGLICCNTVYNNNPLSTQDGDGIQIGAATTGNVNYYDPNNLKNIQVEKNICYKNGRRGIKIQRSNVTATKNFLSDNAIGVSLVRGDYPISSIKVTSNVVQKSYIGINTDGGGKVRVNNSSIADNYLLESIMTDKISLKDAKDLSVSNNSFIRRSGQKYGKDNRYFDISAANTTNIDLDQVNVPDMKLNNSKLFSERKTRLSPPKISTRGTGAADNINDASSHLVVLDKTSGPLTIDETKVSNADYFMVVSNTTSASATVNFKNSKQHRSPVSIKPGRSLILYACKGRLSTYSY